ncbi:nuclear transport factor 2 family protein [Qipengyuania sediminis]|uniref:nuclear transport factor 2 family protein n=1 Tax=Qipengyuania sediminis TaxID=1532023 RepID=UPI00105A3563|nr:nuclear transport factor 2 family protein [Qipengyuania sediminis]
MKCRFSQAMAIGCTALLMGCVSMPPAKSIAGQCNGSPAANRAIVAEFYEQAFAKRDPKGAFERFAAPNFIEHKPDVPEGTRAAVAEYLTQLIAELPYSRWEILRTVSEGNHVFLHVRFTPAPGAPAYAIADLFRVEDCKLVEHWDVVAPPPREQVNPNSRF